jgi:sec-independent protein translocase protein TatA
MGIGDILQPTHLLFILVVALLVLGPKRLPEAGRALGRGLRDFRSAINGDEHDRDSIGYGVSAGPAAPVAAAAPVTEPITPASAETPAQPGDSGQAIEHTDLTSDSPAEPAEPARTAS